MSEKIEIPEGVIEVKPGEEVPEGFVPFAQLVEEKLKMEIEENRKVFLKNKGIHILGVPADEAGKLAKELLETAPEQMTKLMAAVSWLVLNQTDTVDRIGIAVQDMLVFMNQQPGQLNTRNYVITKDITPLTNLRMDFKGRTGDLTQEHVYSYSYQVVAPANEEEYKQGPSAFTNVIPLPRSTHYHLVNQLMMLGAGMEPDTYYISYSVADQDPTLASQRAAEGTNPPLNKSVEGVLKTNLNTP